jgi:UMF1 family MFS transporter
VFAWVVGHSGTSRNAILSILAFFIVGGWLLTLVDVEEGRKAAREGELTVHS